MGELMDRTDAKNVLDLGSSFYGQGKIEEAILHYKKALGLFERTNDLQREADTLLKIGDMYLELDNLEEARKHYNYALEQYGKIKDRTGEGYALTGLGIIFERHGNYEETREYYEKAIKKFQKVKDFKREGMVSNLVANTFKIQDAIEDAVIDYKRSLELFKKVKDYRREVRVKQAMINLESVRSKVKSSKKEIVILIIYLIAISVAEVVIAYNNMKLGLDLEFIILFALLVTSSISKSYNFSNLLRAMMILPMIRIIRLAMPVTQINLLSLFLIIAFLLFATSVTIIRTQKLNRKNVGLILGNIPFQLVIALSGFILGFMEYMILRPQPLISSFNLEIVLVASIILVISTGFAEELLFRGILQKNAENVFGNIYGVIFTSILFTVFHIGWYSNLDILFVFGVAMFYGYIFQKTRSLLGITLSHGICNSVLYLIMPFTFPSIILYLNNIILGIMHYI
jgi:uncharacterized protein